MAYNYEKLWKLLDANDMKRTDLIREAGITSNSLARMGSPYGEGRRCSP